MATSPTQLERIFMNMARDADPIRWQRLEALIRGGRTLAAQKVVLRMVEAAARRTDP